MTCHSVRAIVDLHVEGRLTPARSAEVERHMKTCRGCRDAAAAAVPLAARRPRSAPQALKGRLAELLAAGAAPAEDAPATQVPPRDFDDAPMTRESFVTLEWAAALAAFLLVFNLFGPGIATQGLPEPELVAEARP